MSRAPGSARRAFERVFDEALVQAHDRLRLDPSDREAKVDFVTIYHMVIEGTLGLTASHFLLDFLARARLLPGFVDGYGRIAADEQRHIAYGTWFLREAVAAGPRDGGGDPRSDRASCCPPSPSRSRRRARAPGTCSGSRRARLRSSPSGR